MEPHEIMTVPTVLTNQFALQVYNHQVEIFTRLVAYLAVVSIIMWACVAITMCIRALARRHYGQNRERLRKRL